MAGRVVILFIFLIGSSHTLFAQDHGSITGVVVGAEGPPLAKATVSVVADADSLVLSYVLADDAGAFKLIRIPAQRDLSLYVPHVNSAPFQREVRLAPNEEPVP